MSLPNMNDVKRYTNHYLNQMTASTGESGTVEMKGSSQSGGIGLGSSNSITSRYIIPTSIISKRAVVSVDVHDDDNSDSGWNVNEKKNGNFWRRRRLPRQKRKMLTAPKAKQVGGMRGCGKSSTKKNTQKKVGRFDHLKNNY